jgi:hypothetical protein
MVASLSSPPRLNACSRPIIEAHFVGLAVYPR